jgi:hypothetical protein
MVTVPALPADAIRPGPNHSTKEHQHMTHPTSTKHRADLLENPHIWPGGYERYAVTDDGGTLCRQCVDQNRDEIEATSGADGWCIIALGSADWYDGPDPLQCDHCYRIIQAGDPSLLGAEAGREDGEAAASWVDIPNAEAARGWLEGLTDGDPEVYDRLPAPDLSGQWADGRTAREFAAAAGFDPEADPDEYQWAEAAAAEAYDLAYMEAVTAAVEAAARRILAEQEPST